MIWGHEKRMNVTVVVCLFVGLARCWWDVRVPAWMSGSSASSSASGRCLSCSLLPSTLFLPQGREVLRSETSF